MKLPISIISIFLGIIAIIIVPMIVLGDTLSPVSGQAWANMPNPNDEKKTQNCHPTENDYNKDRVGCGQGLGWIVLNGVFLNATTGQFSGVANSQYGGTVAFSPNTANAPELPMIGAQVSPACLQTTGECAITGWIRFTQASQGWDGWAKMSGVAQNGAPYGVRLLAPDTSGVRKMTGYAWGSNVAGWIDFSQASVTIEPPINTDACSNIPGWTNTNLPTEGAPNIVWTQGSESQCIPTACKIVGDPKYYAPATITVLGTTLNVVANNALCETNPPGDFCDNIPGNQTSLPIVGGNAVRWEREEGNCIPYACVITFGRTITVNEARLTVRNDSAMCNTTPQDCPPGQVRDRNNRCCPPASQVEDGLCPTTGPTFPGPIIET
jgi:hypothetical protein